jgi:hypothetical protein
MQRPSAGEVNARQGLWRALLSRLSTATAGFALVELDADRPASAGPRSCLR